MPPDLTERIAEIVMSVIKTATSPLVTRLAALEARAPVPGPAGQNGRDGKDGAPGLNGADGRDGKDGAPGLNGADGRDGKDGASGVQGERGLPGSDAVLPADWVPRLIALEQRDAELVTEAEIVTELTSLFRRELLGVLPAPPKMQKRIIRDAKGKIDRVIEEPIEAN
jgi:hypothetical protein